MVWDVSSLGKLTVPGKPVGEVASRLRESAPSGFIDDPQVRLALQWLLEGRSLDPVATLADGRTVRLVAITAVTVGLMAYVLLVMQPDDAISTRVRSLSNLPQEQHYVDRVTSWEDTIVPARCGVD